jgi:hypothetical protein
MADTTPARAGLSRAVVWTGMALGTCLAVLAIGDGARLRIGGMPSWAGVILGAIVVWLLISGAATGLAELTRRHHRAAARGAVRAGKRGGLAAGRGAAAGVRGAVYRSRPARHRLANWAQRRWAARRGLGAGTQPGPVSPAGSAAPPAPTGTGGQPVPAGAFPGTGPGAAPAPAAAAQQNTNSTGGTATMTDTGPSVSDRARNLTAASGGSYPAEWKALVSVTADYEPEDDGDLLDWMASEVAGMSAYAEALTEVYETSVSSVGLDPVAMSALHDTADAAADAAAAMAFARQKFAAHYSEVREFAANGGLLPFDGRWMKGEGNA